MIGMGWLASPIYHIVSSALRKSDDPFIKLLTKAGGASLSSLVGVAWETSPAVSACTALSGGRCGKKKNNTTVTRKEGYS